MNIIDSLAASSDVLGVDWADSIPSRSDTKDKWVLFCQFWTRFTRGDG